jgi:type II secretory pathway component PulF
MERDHRTDTLPLASPTAWVLNSSLLAAGLALFFIVPKMEASWLARGMPLSTWATVLISTSHFVIKYGYAILIGLVLWICLRGPSSKLPRG